MSIFTAGIAALLGSDARSMIFKRRRFEPAEQVIDMRGNLQGLCESRLSEVAALGRVACDSFGKRV